MSDTYTEVCQTREQAHEAARRAYAHAQAVLANGEAAIVSCGPNNEPLSIKQRKFLHGPVLTQISEQVRVNGERFVTAIWKEYYRKLFLPDKWEVRKMPGQKRATPQRVRQSTEDLGLKAYSEYIDRVLAHASTDFGVEFRFLAGEREAATYQPSKRERTKALAA